MKAYPAYKPSGVPWLGDVPGHWDAKCLKRLGLFRAGAGFPVDRQGQAGNALPFFKVKDIDGANVGGYLHDTDSSISYEDAKSLGAKVFPHTTIVFAKVGAALLLNRFRLLGCEACIDNNMMGFVLDADLVHPEFARWAMHRINFAELVNPGTVPSLNEPQIANIQIALPPSIAEQQVIADYLDTETARFDELIREKEGLIGLLREHSQGVVSDAVVRGLRRDCSVKGVEGGFGSIPTHWRLVPLKRFVRASGGHTPATDNPAYWDGAMPWVSPKDMKREELSDSIDHVTDAAVDDCGLTVVAPGATLVVVRGMILAHSFPVARNLVPVTINQDMKAIRPESDVLPEYLPWLLRGVTPVVLSLTEQSAHGTLALRTDKFFGEALPIPPASEQAEIVAFLQTELPKIDDLIAHTKDEILLLKELRAATIADAVLGRIDVRTAGTAGKPVKSNNPSV